MTTRRRNRKSRPSRPNRHPLPAERSGPSKPLAANRLAGWLNRKRTLILGLIVSGLIAGMEYAARLHDDNAQFRFQLFKALDMMRSVKTPVVASSDQELGWPENTVFVRDPAYSPAPREPYVVGGKTIPEARPDARQLVLQPNRADPRARVFILGESAAFGFPLAYGETFAAHLEGELSPRGYRVFNAGEPAWCSGQLVPVARRIVDCFKPQTLILYMGNNEWIHWLPANEIPNPRALGVFRFLAHSRAVAYCEYLLARWLVNRSHSRAASFDSQHELTGSDYALKHPLNEPLSHWEDTKQSFLTNFETNLVNIIQYAKTRNVTVILTTVPFYYKLSPAWKHPQPVAFAVGNQAFVQDSVDQALAACKNRDYALALQKLEVALAREPSVALLHYLKGATLEAAGKPAEAEASYANCRENMVGNLGSMLSINQTIRKVAAATEIQLVDLQSVFDEYEHGRNHFFNDDLILDDCHPTPLGHRLIAQSLLHSIPAPSTRPALNRESP